MCQTEFVPVTGDDWYQRRRKDREGEFFRKLAADAGKQGHTLQGIYVFAADGTALAYRNSGQSAEITKQVMTDALAAFRKLPEASRKPTIEDAGKVDGAFDRT